MKKCQICKQNERTWTWQPFGPDESPTGSFSVPGSHYRGFPTIGVCDDCKENIENGVETHYTYRGQEYIVNKKETAMPEEPKIYKTWEEAQEAMDRGETVRVEMEPFAIDPQLVQLALDLQAKERLEQWKEQQKKQQ